MNGFHALTSVFVFALSFLYDKLHISGDASGDVAAVGTALAAVIALVGVIRKRIQNAKAAKKITP
jgi:hypothetical protein